MVVEGEVLVNGRLKITEEASIMYQCCCVLEPKTMSGTSRM